MNGRMYAVLRCHDTDGVTVEYPSGTVTLNTGGHATDATKKRMKAVMPTGWMVYEHQFDWYLAGPLRPMRPAATTDPARFDRRVEFTPLDTGGMTVTSDADGTVWRDWSDPVSSGNNPTA